MKTFIFGAVLLVLVFVEISSTKDFSEKHSKISHPRNQRAHHKEKIQHSLRNHRHNHVWKSRDWYWMQRCTITCPPLIPIHCNGSNTHPNHTQTTTRKTPTTTTEGTSDEESESSSDEEISPNEQGRQNSTQVTVGNTTTTSKPNATRRNYHHLPRIHRRILLKQLHTGNRHGRKSYKFRQLQPFQCSVQCENAYDKPDSGLIMGYPHQSPPADDVDEDSDSYEEGEDTPIEATIRPYVPENLVLGGVKPFGFWPDFMGWDDFGPDGELARDPLFIAEEDKRSKAKGLRKHREKMKIKQEEKKHV